jgi:serine protease Do
MRDLAGAHPFSGAQVANIGPAIADELGLDAEGGVVVLATKKGSVAANLGLQRGDIIVQIGARRIDSVAELEQLLQTRQRLWQVAVRRGNQLLKIQVPG